MSVSEQKQKWILRKILWACAAAEAIVGAALAGMGMWLAAGVCLITVGIAGFALAVTPTD